MSTSSVEGSQILLRGATDSGRTNSPARIRSEYGGGSMRAASPNPTRPQEEIPSQVLVQLNDLYIQQQYEEVKAKFYAAVAAFDLSNIGTPREAICVYVCWHVMFTDNAGNVHVNITAELLTQAENLFMGTFQKPCASTLRASRAPHVICAQPLGASRHTSR
jgi:hypothetical protein